MSQQQPGKAGAGGAAGQVPMPFPLVQNIAQLSELRCLPSPPIFLGLSMCGCQLCHCFALLSASMFVSHMPVCPRSSTPQRHACARAGQPRNGAGRPAAGGTALAAAADDERWRAAHAASSSAGTAGTAGANAAAHGGSSSAGPRR